MRSLQRARGRLSTRKVAVTLTAGLAVLLGPALVPSASADEATASETAGESAPVCSPAELRELRSMADRFAAGCSELGPDYGAMDDSDAKNTAFAAITKRNMNLVDRTERSGEFDQSTFSDLAFRGKYAFSGNYDGFTVFDISNPRAPREVSRLVCPGAQGDISVYGNILVTSVDSRRTDDSCQSEPAPAPVEGGDPVTDYWEGVRVFDITRPARPEYVASVETDCGSHTHSLAPSRDGKNVFAYVSSYSPSPLLADCQPPHDKISVVKIPVAEPGEAKLATTPVLFGDGGNPGGTQNGNTYSATSGCHDITTYPKKNIAAGACMGDGILMDISNRYKPVVTEVVRDTENFAFWHSATFNNAGTKVVFTDELGGGGAATCNPTVGQERGANGIYDITKRGQLDFQSYYKIPRTQTDTENCVAHNGSLIPVKGKDIMVQAWYMGGISVFDFTDSANPKELAWFDRGPEPEGSTDDGGNWSSYWHNGFIYSNDIGKGFNVFNLNVPSMKKALNAAKKVRLGTNNPQAQTQY